MLITIKTAPKTERWWKKSHVSTGISFWGGIAFLLWNIVFELVSIETILLCAVLLAANVFFARDGQETLLPVAFLRTARRASAR